jgi:hypothetical protein
VKVSLEHERATVDYDPSLLTAAQLEETIQYTVLLPRMRRLIERIARPRRSRSAR